MRAVKTRVVPVLVGAAGTVPLRLKCNLKHTGVGKSIDLFSLYVLFPHFRPYDVLMGILL